MNPSFFLLLPYPYLLPYLTPLTHQLPQTPYIFTPYNFPGLQTLEFSSPSNQTEALGCPESSETVKMEEGSCMPKEETSTRPPSRFRYPKKNV
jgi:hypothetical protein